MKYVRCDSHCKFPAYDKEEIDNLLKDKASSVDIYTKDDYAIISATTTISSEASTGGIYTGGFMANLPAGFTYENSVVISMSFKSESDTGYAYSNREDVLTTNIIDYGMSTNALNGNLTTTNSAKAGVKYIIKIVVMKIA